jgi:excisionase family DNA binding protein
MNETIICHPPVIVITTREVQMGHADYTDAERTGGRRPLVSSGLALRWDDLGDLLKPVEVALLLRISRSSCYEALRSGALKPIAIKWGRRYLIPKTKLRGLVESEDGPQAPTSVED